MRCVLTVFSWQAVQAILAQAKKLNKAAYIFSVDSDGEKVVHANHVPQLFRKDGFDAKAWANAVSEIVQGKAGGKDDGAQGVGTDTARVEEALSTARDMFAKVG